MAWAGLNESFDFWNIAVASFQTSTLIMPFLLLNNMVTSASVLLWFILWHLAGTNYCTITSAIVRCLDIS